MFISIEGVDGVGKTSIRYALEKELRRKTFSVNTIDEFPQNYLDNAIQKLLEREPFLRLHPNVQTTVSQTLLLLSLHAFKYKTLIEPALHKIQYVIVDRYIDSVFAYQSVLLQEIGMVGAVAREWIEQCARFHPMPDLTIFIDMKTAVAVERRQARGDVIGYDEQDFLTKVEDEYNKHFSNMSRRVLRVNNEGSLEDTIDEIIELMGLL